MKQSLLSMIGLLAGICLSSTATAQEFDTLDAATKRQSTNYTGFVFDFFTGARAEPSPNGFQVPANVATDPFTAALDGFGNSLNLLNLGPCAGNSPHVHPRGAEISTIVRGNIQFGFVEENAGRNRLVVVDAKAGQVVFIPQGLIHFSHNLDCTPAAFIANFGNRDPGTQTIWAALMQIPTPILAASLNIDDSQECSESIINKWKQRQLVNAPATGGAECLKRCKVSYKQANNFTDSPAQLAQAPGPIVPTDQRGQPQSFAAGGKVAGDSENRCDFLGISELPGQPGPQECANTDSYDPSYLSGNWRRRLQETAAKLQKRLPKDKITVMDAGKVADNI